MSFTNLSKPDLPRPAMLLTGYALSASLLGAGLFLVHLPSEPLILLIVPIIFAALFYSRLVCLSMLIELAVVSTSVAYLSSESFYTSLRTITVLSVTVAVVAEIIHRSTVARMQAQNALIEANGFLQALIGASPLPIITADLDGHIKTWSKAAERVFGWTEQEVVGRWNPIIPDDKQEEFRDIQWRLRQGDVFVNFVTRRQRQDGSPIDVSVSTALLRDAKGAAKGVMAVITDITEIRRAEEIIRHQAYHDPLTGLPNRLLFGDRLSLALARVRRDHEMLAVMFLDLDHFKKINDTLGHSIGDQLLQAVALRLTNHLREGDTIARFGGDEFTLLLDIGSREDSDQLAKRVLEAFRSPFRLVDREVSITTSIGISLYPYDGEDAPTLLRNADIALYRAKEQGRDNYQSFTSVVSGLL